MLQSFLVKLLKSSSAEDTLVPSLWEKRGTNVCFLFYFFMGLHATEPVLSR